MRVLVLGSSGQIGAPLCKHLHSEGHKVIEWDIEDGPEFDLRNLDNMAALSRQVMKADFVFFLAYDVGGSNYLASNQSSTSFIDNNLDIMRQVFFQLDAHKTPFVFASSQMATMSHSQYGVLKRLGEFQTRALGGIVVRFWNIYGPEHEEKKFHVISDFIRMARDEGRILCGTTGEEERNFMHVDDCCYLLRRVMEEYDGLLNGEGTFWYEDPGFIDFGSSYEWFKIRTIAELIAREMKVPAYFGTKKDEVQGVKNDPGYRPMRQLLGSPYEMVPLDVGIKKIIQEMTRG